MDYCTPFEPEETGIPDMYTFECDGHAVDVRTSDCDSYKIELHFWSKNDHEVVVRLTAKDARELRKEMKAAGTLIRIADDI